LKWVEVRNTLPVGFVAELGRSSAAPLQWGAVRSSPAVV